MLEKTVQFRVGADIFFRKLNGLISIQTPFLEAKHPTFVPFLVLLAHVPPGKNDRVTRLACRFASNHVDS